MVSGGLKRFQVPKVTASRDFESDMCLKPAQPSTMSMLVLNLIMVHADINL